MNSSISKTPCHLKCLVSVPAHRQYTALGPPLDVSGMTGPGCFLYFEAFQKVISEILDIANLTKCITAVPGVSLLKSSIEGFVLSRKGSSFDPKSPKVSCTSRQLSASRLPVS